MFRFSRNLVLENPGMAFSLTQPWSNVDLATLLGFV
jgi:hypothetical protein